MRLVAGIVAGGLAAAPAPLSAMAATYSDVLPLPGVVWIAGALPPPPRVAAIHQTMRAFVADLLVVPVGTNVTFPNDDPFDHSVYSQSPGNAFDIGLYGAGPGKSVRFGAQGIVDIR